MNNQNETVTTYQIGNATVRIHGDPAKLDREKLADIFAEFMREVYDFRAQQASQTAQQVNQDDQGA